MENFKDIIDKFVIKFSESTKDAFEMAQEAYTSESDNIDETKVDEMQKN